MRLCKVCGEFYDEKEFEISEDVCKWCDVTIRDDETITVIRGEHGMVATNGSVGGWVKCKDGSFVSLEYAESINRKQRRKQGIMIPMGLK